MANRFARKTGNSNASDVWSDTPSGTAGAQFIPGVGDVAIANSYTITVNVNTTCDAVRNDTTGGATNGGTFLLSDGVTLTANVYAGTPTNTGAVQYAGSTSATLIGDTVAGGGSGSYGIHHSGTGTLTVTGNVTGGSGSNNCYGIYNASKGTAAISGNVIGGSGTNAVGAYNTSTGTLTVTGSVTGGSGSGATGAHNASTGTMRVGVAVGNDHGPGYASNNFNVGVYGYGTNSGGQPTTTVGGIKYGAYGMSPTSGRVLFDPNYDASATAILIRETTFAQVTFTGPANTSADPAEADVREGTTYRFGAKTGTCSVPPAGSVAFGVPVDATTGTAVLTGGGATAQEVWEYATRTLTSGGGGGGATAQEVWEYATRALTDKAAFTLHADYDAAKTAASAASVAAIPTTPLLAANYTAPANSDITAIKAKTDNLPVDPASQASVSAIPTAPLLAADYTAPDNAGIAAANSAIAALHDFDPVNDTVAHTNVSSILGQSLTGSGTSADPWRPA